MWQCYQSLISKNKQLILKYSLAAEYDLDYA